MILNNKYYENLLNTYDSTKLVSIKSKYKIIDLTCKMIMEQNYKNQSIHINFQNRADYLFEIGYHLYIELANKIFVNYPNFPPLNINDRLRSNKPFLVENNKRLYEFKITDVIGNSYVLKNETEGLTLKRDFENLITNFTPVTQNVQNQTLSKFSSFFTKLNGKQSFDFTPTYFDKKCVCIAQKHFWDTLSIKNNIPTTYFPNPREEGNVHESKTIPALTDSIMYFTPKYEMCYQKILLMGKKIDTILLFNTEEEKLQHIIQDKNRFGFNLIVISNATMTAMNPQIPCWNWYKEEIELINAYDKV